MKREQRSTSVFRSRSISRTDSVFVDTPPSTDFFDEGFVEGYSQGFVDAGVSAPEPSKATVVVNTAPQHHPTAVDTVLTLSLVLCVVWLVYVNDSMSSSSSISDNADPSGPGDTVGEPSSIGIGDPAVHPSPSGPGDTTVRKPSSLSTTMLEEGSSMGSGDTAVLEPSSKAATVLEPSAFGPGDTVMQPNPLGPGATVLKLSVSMNVPNRDDPKCILALLDTVAETAETDSRVGLQDLASEVALDLLRRKSSMISASSVCKHFERDILAIEEYNKVSVEERSKFEYETVNRYSGVDYKKKEKMSTFRRLFVRSKSVASKATMAVVTILLVIDGNKTEIPSIYGIQDVENALRTIAADVKIDGCLQCADIFWTPADETETLLLEDVMADYPDLQRL